LPAAYSDPKNSVYSISADPEDGSYDPSIHETPFAYVHDSQPYQEPQQQQRLARPASRPQPQLQNYYQPQQQAAAASSFNQNQLFRGHPARNVDLNEGSYRLSYAG